MADPMMTGWCLPKLGWNTLKTRRRKGWNPPRKGVLVPEAADDCLARGRALFREKFAAVYDREAMEAHLADLDEARARLYLEQSGWMVQQRFEDGHAAYPLHLQAEPCRPERLLFGRDGRLLALSNGLGGAAALAATVVVGFAGGLAALDGISAPAWADDGACCAPSAPPPALTPAPPGEKVETIDFSPDLTVPAVAKAQGGFGSDWRSDVWIHNGDAQKDATVKLFYAPAGTSVDPENFVTITVARHQTVTLADIVGTTFKTTGAGALFLDVENADPLKFVVESNVYNRVDDQKQFGQQLPGLRTAELPTDLQDAYRLPASPDIDNYRANLGITTLECTNVLIRAYNDVGNILYEQRHTLPAYSWVQFNDVIKSFNLPTINNIQFELLGTGRFIPYMSIVDNQTSDGSAFLGQTLSQVDTTQWMPGIARAAGAQGSLWRSDLMTISPHDFFTTLLCNYVPADGGWNNRKDVVVETPAFSLTSWPDIVYNIFLIDQGFGSLRVNDLPEGVKFSWIRTYNQTDMGTYGQNIPAKGERDMIKTVRNGVGDVVQDLEGVLTGVNHNDVNRANLVLQNTLQQGLTNFIPATASVTVMNEYGDVVGQKAYPLEAGHYVQVNRFVEDISGTGATLTNGTVTVTMPTPYMQGQNSGGIDARISVVNGNTVQGTNDGRLITAQNVVVNDDPLEARAKEYVAKWLDTTCEGFPPEMQYDPDGDGRCAPAHFYLNNAEVRSMIKGCDPQGSTGYTCGTTTGKSVPSYAHEMAEILFRDPRAPAAFGSVEGVESWLKEQVDEVSGNAEFWHAWDPMLWQAYTAQGTEDNRIRFYGEPTGNPVDFFLPERQDILDLYSVSKQYLVRTISVNPEWYGGDNTEGANLEYDSTWSDQNPN